MKLGLKELKEKNGYASIIALIMVGMLTILGLAALSGSDDELSIASNNLQEMKAFYAAEAGLEIAAANLLTEFDSTGVPPLMMPTSTADINNCEVTYATTDNGPAVQKVLSDGVLAGLHALVKSYTIVAVADNSVDNALVEVTQVFETAMVPIFQFAVFYDTDLEIAPGPLMTLLGRVHSNRDLYLQSGSGLNIDSYISSAGDIRHGRHPESGMSTSNGDVFVKNSSGAYKNMKLPDDSWLDSDRSVWYDSSVARWQGRIQDKTHGQGVIHVPVSHSSNDPHKLIERASGGNTDSYEDKSSLKFIDQRAYQLVGSVWNDVTSDMETKGIISFADNQFYDGRENINPDLMELDMAKLYSEGYAPVNGVIYYSDNNGSRDYPALRLNSGDSLYAPLTIASENPVYTNGDYNNLDKKPASILADAVTYLSNSWDDSKSTMSKSNRVASNTTVNACYLTGNVSSSGGSYSGGFENLPRFLETWSGKTFSWRGSAVNLWVSRQAVGIWGGSYYDPPNRDWLYDTDLDDPYNLPPETPVVRTSQRVGWKQSYVAY